MGLGSAEEKATHNYNQLCGRPPQHAPTPCKLTFDLESGVRFTCDVGYLYASFSLPRPLCSWLRPNVRDRPTDVRHASSLNASTLWGRVHNDRNHESLLT